MRRALLLLALTTLGVAACDDDPAQPTGPRTLELSFQGLDPLQNGFHYEGWALIGGEALPTGKFNVDGSGGLVDLGGAPIEDGAFEVAFDLTDLTAVVITIEPDGDTDDVPASTHILAGPASGGAGALTAGSAQALGDDFTGAGGTYILATPTDGATDTDETSGLWFLVPGGTPSLTLPALPAGWAYEGWAVIDGTPVTTGTFLTASGVDAAAPYSGAADGPPFPGEDFVANAPAGLDFPTDLSGGTAVISIEPVPDDSPMPFTFKPLVGAIPGDAQDRVSYDLAPNLGSFPTGSFEVR